MERWVVSVRPGSNAEKASHPAKTNTTVPTSAPATSRRRPACDMGIHGTGSGPSRGAGRWSNLRAANRGGPMAKMTGAAIMARELKKQGVDYMFGIVGFPVRADRHGAQKAGITFIGMRNEQSASYAAQAASATSPAGPRRASWSPGPGVIHALAGLANAKENCWPMILIGGAVGPEPRRHGATSRRSARSSWPPRTASSAAGSRTPAASRTSSSRPCAPRCTAGPGPSTSTCPTT